MRNFGISRLTIASITLHLLISTHYELDQDGYAGLTRSLTLRIPFDPATIRCSLASTAEAVSAEVQENSDSIQLGLTDIVINMEDSEAYPVLFCILEPDGFRLFLPYNHGIF